MKAETGGFAGVATILPPYGELTRVFDLAAQGSRALAQISEMYRTRKLFNGDPIPVEMSNSMTDIREGRIIWYLVTKLEPKLTIETGFGFGVSASFILAASAGWNGRLISIDPLHRKWCGGLGLTYLDMLGLSSRHEIVELASEIKLPEYARFEFPERLRFSFLDGSHHFDTTLIDFVYLDKLTEMGGIIAIDDADSPAARTLASYIAHNLPYALHYATNRLLLCQKIGDASKREWSHFKPFKSSARTDWDLHPDLPDEATVPGATFYELALG